MLPSGGGALAQQIFRDYHPSQPLPSAGELHGAVDDLAADGLITPQMADHLHAGGNAPDRHLAANVADRVATGRGLPSILDPQSAGLQAAQRQFVDGVQDQAQNEAQAVMMGDATAQFGGAVANGATNGRPPIANVHRWQGAAQTYQTHAQQMMQLAPTPAHAIAISQIAATSSGIGKAAIRDVFSASHPNADMSTFTPALMKGS